LDQFETLRQITPQTVGKYDAVREEFSEPNFPMRRDSGGI
jgi:hypothetical protein